MNNFEHKYKVGDEIVVAHCASEQWSEGERPRHTVPIGSIGIIESCNSIIGSPHFNDNYQAIMECVFFYRVRLQVLGGIDAQMRSVPFTMDFIEDEIQINLKEEN